MEDYGKKKKKHLTFFLFAYWHDPRWNKFVGATVKIWDLAHNLTKQGHSVVLFIPKFHIGTGNLPFKVVEIPFLDIPFLRFLSFNMFLTIYLLALFLRRRPDVVYMRRMNSIIPALYAMLQRAAFFYEINDDPYRNSYQEGSFTTFRIRSYLSEKQDEFNLRFCSRAFVITPEIARKILSRNSSLENGKLLVMPSGANVDLFRPLDRKKCRCRLNFDLGKKYVGFAGTLLNYQGVDILIDAASLILREEPSSIFVIIGEGPMKDLWISEVEKKKLHNFFLFPGQIDYENMPIWIGAMNICVAPFLDKAGLSSPVKIFDYMACGRAVVASRIRGTTDVFADSDAIKLVPPGNVKMLADAIVELLRDINNVDLMGEKGRTFIVENFDRQKMTKMISDEAIACRS